MGQEGFPYLQPVATVSSLLLKVEDPPVGCKGHHLLRRETQISMPPVGGRIAALQKCPHLNPKNLQLQWVLGHSGTEVAERSKLLIKWH